MPKNCRLSASRVIRPRSKHGSHPSLGGRPQDRAVPLARGPHGIPAAANNLARGPLPDVELQLRLVDDVSAVPISLFTFLRAEARTVKLVCPVQDSARALLDLPGLLQLSSISKTFPDAVTPEVILTLHASGYSSYPPGRYRLVLGTSCFFITLRYVPLSSTFHLSFFSV